MAHINSFVRIPLLALRQRVRPLTRIGIFETDQVAMRVWPNDVDFNLHLNNSRFLSCMDYARMHMIASLGLLDVALRERWTPLVGSVFITYRKSLPLFRQFEIHSRVVCWDERWIYMEQIFRSEGQVAAIAWVKGLFRRRGENVAPQSVANLTQIGAISPPLPEAFLQWNDLTREKLREGSATIGAAVTKG